MKNVNFKICLKELKEERAKFFEAKLAETFLDCCTNLASTKKVSSAIIKLLINNKDRVLGILEDNKIRDELYNEKIYGHLDIDSVDSITPIKIYNQLIETLTQSDYKIIQIVNIHSVFIHRIFDKIASEQQKDQKAPLVSKLFSSNLFSEDNRGRTQIKFDFDLIKSSGANRSRFFTKKLQETQTHAPAFLRFAADEQSSFFRTITKLGMPLIAGASGHTGSFLLGALLYGDLTQKELREYCFTCALTLIQGGNHSLHEIMIVAQQVNIPYQAGNYLSAIPDIIQQQSEFLNLCSEFSEFLDQPNLGYSLKQ